MVKPIDPRGCNSHSIRLSKTCLLRDVYVFVLSQSHITHTWAKQIWNEAEEMCDPEVQRCKVMHTLSAIG